MWRFLLPLMVLACLVGCAPSTVTTDIAPFESGSNAEAVPPTTASGSTADETVTSAGLFEIGSAAAPHTLLLFLTPDSPYSERYASDHLPKIIVSWVNSGQLRVRIAFVEFQRYPLGPVIEAMICTSVQKKMAASLSGIIINPAATPADIDLAKYQQCLADTQTRTLAAQLRTIHQDLAASLHVSLVPTAILNGEKQTGLPEWSDLEADIEQMLSE